MLKKLLVIPFLFFSLNIFSQSESITLISWNIQDFGKTKSSEELDEIAEIVRYVDIIAIQEVVAGYGGAQAVAKLTDILNRKGYTWDYAISNPTNSSKYVTERYAFIWKNKHIKIKNRGRLITELDAVIDREPFLLDFYINKKKFSIVNFHSRPFNKNPESEIKALTTFISDFIGRPLIIAGDFNVNETKPVFDDFKNIGFTPAVNNQKTTLKKVCKQNKYLNHSIDNIFSSKEIDKIESKVIDFVKFCENLEKARKLSDHLPVFLKFSI
ncbi:endonuclease/exonuclease/phosphatase family protein [Flavivirga jejuensis]|uniref:Endonuclease/exonuclease/phosphatase family protein n=1 Tax=Flavivirga jejuensis TaxID=870487 RepID=A0ABT8WRA1_9FLAO|nr:endonuclease/exonuclease/phosphatase family protein [Flavivirga jejuensis]MDO5975712.1 endonuclease/exonuclease/phosphatase family protein [Flavivirga jejuensis]